MASVIEMLAERRLDSKSCYRGLTRFGAARLVRAGDALALQIFFVGQLDPELAELLQIDVAGGLRHKVLAAVVFRECHHIAD